MPPLCLNKSCSRSFYLHMLTGTSEFPRGEMWREKDGEEKTKTEKETQRWRKTCAHHCCKGLSGLFSSHGVILIKPCSSDLLFLIHTHTEIEKVQDGDEIDLKKKKQVKRRCLCTYSNYYKRWRIRSTSKPESDGILIDSFADSRYLKVALFPLIPHKRGTHSLTCNPAQIKPMGSKHKTLYALNKDMTTHRPYTEMKILCKISIIHT